MLLHHQVGRFEIRDFLGRGAMGDVVLAWDPDRQAEVALKVIRLRKTDPEMLEAEKNGVSLQQQLSRAAPQVAAVYEWGEDGDFFWVEMEYVAGVDLSAVLSRGALPDYRAVDIALQLCAMLEICHEFSAEMGGRKVFGVVHGDIKPENIRLQEEDRVRVLDFGIAKHLSQTRRFTVNLFGSLPYTPPERLERGIVDRHSDLWAVGIVLYIMVSGNRPFPGDTPEELDRRIRRGEPPLPLPASCPARLKQIIYKSLAPTAEQRYATAADLRADLEAFLEERPLAGETAANGVAAASDLSATRRTDRPLGTAPAETAEARVEATRRTDRAVELGYIPSEETAAPTAPAAPGSDATRRTFSPEPPVPPAPFPQAPQSPQPPQPPQSPPGLDLERSLGSPSLGLGRWFAVAVLIVALGAAAIGHGWVRSEAGEIQRALAAGKPDLAGLSARYEQVSRFSFLGGKKLTAAGEDLREALLGAADRVLDAYHGDDPASSEKGWQDASGFLKTAYGIKRDSPTRARILYCQAHLDRIEAQSLRQQGKNRDAAQKTDEAMRGFREAARRDPEWPDPFLGLARVYAYQRFDLAELEKAIGQLGRRGYKIGRREKAMLADGYRMQAHNLFDRAVQTRGSDEEAGYLDKTRDHLERAIEYYDEIPRYANVEKNRDDSEQLLGRIEARLDEIEQPGFEIQIPFWPSNGQ